MKITPTVIEMNLSEDNSLFTAICCLYLLEGSRHGAFKILHHFQSILPQDYTFYFLYNKPELFHKKWGIIIQVMDSLIKNDEIFNEIVIKINDMYKSIGELYDDYSTINKL
jgi:heme oxygenase